LNINLLRINKTINSRVLFLHVVLPLIYGIAIYLFWRGFPLLDPDKNIFPLFASYSVPAFIKYNLSDGLFFYAFLSALIFIWGKKLLSDGLIWLSASILLSLVWEILQIQHIVAGTFDLLDVLAYLIAGFACSFQFINYKKAINKYLNI